MRSDKTKDLIHFHFLVFLWGFTSILGALIELNSIQIVWHRMFIASFLVGLYIFASKRKMFFIKRKYFTQLLIAGLLISSHWVAFSML